MKIGIHIVPPSVEFITPKHFPNWAEGWLNLIEECGRNCYQSEPKKGDTAAKFIKRHRIHESILEHGVFTVNFTGSRSMSHQLVRHRIAAYSQESQRFCDYTSDRLQEVVDETPDEETLGDVKLLKVILPPSIIHTIDEIPGALAFLRVYQGGGGTPVLASGQTIHQWSQQQFGWSSGPAEAFERWCQGRIDDYEEYVHWRELGVPSEDARSCLPNATKTSVMTTYNFRVWRHVLGHPVFGRALNDHAQWEIKGIMMAVLEYFEEHVPSLVEDLRERAA
jgi:thymidylate synthase ThyX